MLNMYSKQVNVVYEDTSADSLNRFETNVCTLIC